jgi:hypothetical protein
MNVNCKILLLLWSLLMNQLEKASAKAKRERRIYSEVRAVKSAVKKLLELIMPDRRTTLDLRIVKRFNYHTTKKEVK